MRILTFALCLLCFSVSAQIDWNFPYNPDSDNDGYIYSEDLLDLLAVYGQEYSSDELYLSQDSTSLIVNVGVMPTIDCLEACVTLDGNWYVLNQRDLLHFREFLTLPEVSIPDGAAVSPEDYGVFMWYLNEENSFPTPNDWNMTFTNRTPIPNGWNGTGYNEIKPSFTYGNSSGYHIDNQRECWCVTHERPKVEWHRISNNDFESNKDELSQNGWRLHTTDGPGGQYLFWRWAE